MAETKEEKEARETKEREDAQRRADRAKKYPRRDGESDEAYEGRCDAEEREERRDSSLKSIADGMTAMADSLKTLGARMDAYDAEKKEREDKARKDAEEEAARKAAEGDPEKAAADKARKDAEETEKIEREAKEKEEKDRADRERADSEWRASIEARLPKERTRADIQLFSDVQARADLVYTAFGDRAPMALNGEDLIGYRRRLIEPFKKHSADWKDQDLSVVSGMVLDVAEKQIFADAQSAAAMPGNVAYGHLHMTEKRLDGGHIMRTFHGQPGSWMDEMAGPVRQYAKAGLLAGEGRLND